MEIKKAIETINKKVTSPSLGLPDDLFYFVTTITPMVNVDLLIKDENGRTLLSWRNDRHSGRGWHLPGGIVRFKETMEQRVKKVAETEIGMAVNYDKNPIAINEIINKHRKIRGHFISVLYRCYLPSDFTPKNKGRSNIDPGYLMWHKNCPSNLLRLQNIYKKYI